MDEHLKKRDFKFVDFSRLSLRDSQLRAESAFPRRDDLLRAASVISQGHLITEGPEGLEDIEMTLRTEQEARNQFGMNGEFLQARLKELNALLFIAESAIRHAEKDGNLDKIADARIKYNTYVIALQPNLGLDLVAAARKYRSGDDFQDGL